VKLTNLIDKEIDSQNMLFILMLGVIFTFLGIYSGIYWHAHSAEVLWQTMLISCGECFSNWSCTAWTSLGYGGALTLFLLGIAMIFYALRPEVII